MTDEVIVVYANSLFLSRPNKTPSQRNAYPPKKKVEIYKLIDHKTLNI